MKPAGRGRCAEPPADSARAGVALPLHTVGCAAHGVGTRVAIAVAASASAGAAAASTATPTATPSPGPSAHNLRWRILLYVLVRCGGEG